LLNSSVIVTLTYIQKGFWTALSVRNEAQFYTTVARFFGALLCGIPVSVLYDYQRERLALYWREKLTAGILGLPSLHPPILVSYDCVHYLPPSLFCISQILRPSHVLCIGDPSGHRQPRPAHCRRCSNFCQGAHLELIDLSFEMYLFFA
jgi:hypothetical protein